MKDMGRIKELLEDITEPVQKVVDSIIGQGRADS
jgi:hypothetical protein